MQTNVNRLKLSALTHGEVPHNILSKITELLDQETAGNFPEFWEYYRCVTWDG